MKSSSDLRLWQVKATKRLDDLLQQVISEGLYVSKSDFIREAVREKLERMGFTSEGRNHRETA